jgi:hypothetical protein
VYHQWGGIIRGRPKGLPSTSQKMTTSNVTASSTKAEIIDASIELIEIQSETITDLQDRQLVLLVLVGILSVLLLLRG